MKITVDMKVYKADVHFNYREGEIQIYAVTMDGHNVKPHLTEDTLEALEEECALYIKELSNE